MAGIDLVFGTVGWGDNPKEKNEGYVKLLKQHKVTRLDTASQYVRTKSQSFRRVR